MARQLFVNNFEFPLVGDVLATPATGTPATELGYGILQLSNSATSVLAALTGGDWYILTLFKRTGSVESQYEIVKVLGVNEVAYVSGTECRVRVDRAQEGTAAQAYLTGDFVAMRFTSGGATNMLQVAHNLADVASAATARTNLGLGTAAVAATSDFTPAAHVGSGAGAHANVVAAGAAGFMTGADKTKLDGIATGATANTGTVTAVSVITGNGFTGSVTGAPTPAITLTTSVTGMIKGNGTALSAATAGTDYQAPIGTISGLAKGNGANALTSATASDVTGQLITGYVSGSGTVAATDTILQAINKLNGNDALKAPLISPTFTTPNIGVATGTSFNSITGFDATVPVVAGTASAGAATTAARRDHVHPAQTTVSGNAGTVTNATLTTALTVNTGTVGLVGNMANTSVLTLGAGASSVSGANTGDNAANTTYASDYRAANFVAGTNYLAPNGSAAALTGFPTFNQDTTGFAGALKSATTTVSVSGAAAPTVGQVLTAVDGVTATWQAPASGGASLSANNTWTGSQTFTNSLLKLLGSSTGATTFSSANASATNYTLTFPAITDTLVTLTAAQTLTNKTLTAPVLGTPASGNLSNCTSDGTSAVGFRGIPQNSKSTAYTLVLSDAGKHILHPSTDATARTFTIPANSSVAFPIGTTVTFINQNGGGVVSIAISDDNMRLAGAGTTGTRSLAANGVATAVKIVGNEWIIYGTGLT